jgi:ubiquinol-cytochrome c reductase cytochrome b subunit
MMKTLRNLALWFDDRLHLTKLFEETAGHPVPKNAGSWFYVFGSATLLCLVVQIVTGICLALVYVPSGGEAYTTLWYLTLNQDLGWFLRALHNWGSNFMVCIMMLHMTQVFLWGAYKYPREMTWISGCALLVITLGLAFTGQVLRFDEDAYWGLGIGASILARTPFLGDKLVHLMLGGPIIAADTLSRFFSLHVFVLPGLILALVGFHLRLVLLKGINEYPKPGVQVRRKTYDAEYHAILEKDGVPFVPKAISKDLVAAGIVLIGIFACAAIFGPKGPTGPPTAMQIDSVPRPDAPFMWIFAVAALLPDYLEDVVILGGPVLLGIFLVALPFISNEGEKSWRRRPIAVVTVIFLYLAIGLLTRFGYTSPWSPDMNAWTSASIGKEYLEGRTPLELAGASLLQVKQCRNCHAIGGVGGHRGPDLGDVGARMTAPQLARQIIQGGGNMPAYGKNLTPSEVSALVAYMVTLHSKGVPPARDSTVPATPPPSNQQQPKEAKISVSPPRVSLR